MTLVADDLLVIIALPDGAGVVFAEASIALRDLCFELPDDGAQRIRLQRRGDPPGRPYNCGFIQENDHDAMQMIGHDHEGIEVDIGADNGRFLPFRINQLPQ